MTEDQFTEWFTGEYKFVFSHGTEGHARKIFNVLLSASKPAVAWMDPSDQNDATAFTRDANEAHCNPDMFSVALAASPAVPAQSVVPAAREHELKTDPEVFAAVLGGSKTHEIRFNDRDFKIDDTLRLRETRYTGQEMRGPEPRPLEYTGREVTRVVSHVLEGYGLLPGWAILSLAAPAQSGEPVKPAMWFASKDPDDEGFIVHKEREAKDCEQDGYDVTPLYAAPQPVAQSKP